MMYFTNRDIVLMEKLGNHHDFSMPRSDRCITKRGKVGTLRRSMLFGTVCKAD
jgi:hypothetical protein